MQKENTNQTNCYFQGSLLGMTPTLNNAPSSWRARTEFTGSGVRVAHGFTLIVLLVIMLIIGILAAIAVPQYQKAVWRSRNAQIKELVRTVAQAQDLYYLEHGQYAANFSELDIDLSLKPRKSENVCGWAVQGTDSFREGKDFLIILGSLDLKNPETTGVLGGWIKGKYSCKYFSWNFGNKKMKCISARYAGIRDDTSFCTSIEHGINPITSQWSYEWDLP